MAVPTIGPTLGVVATGDGMGDRESDAIGSEEVHAYADAPGMVGIAAATLTATTTAQNAGRQLRVSVYTPGGVLIAHLPRRSGLAGMAEHNAPGSGQLTVHAYDDVLEEHPTLWDDGNIVRVSLGAKEIQAWVMEGWSFDRAADGSMNLTRTGRGDLSILDNAVLYPELTLHRLTSDDRFFNFGSVEGDWYVPKEWGTPKGVRYRKSHRYPLPKKWPFKRAQWLWAGKGPEKPTPNQRRNYFRSTITVTENTNVRMWAAGDDTLLLFVDGNLVLRHNRGGWRKVKSHTMLLTPGTHVVAAMVRNDTESGDDRCGFLFGAAKVNKKGEILDTLLVSKPTKWKVRRALSAPPGWFPSQVLAAFVEEGQARGVESFDTFTLGYTNKKDSSGRPWRDRISQSYRIGTRGMDLTTQLSERGMDVAMKAGKLHAWIERGYDLSRFVALDGWIRSTGSGSTSHIVTEALVKYRQGWTDFTSAPLQSVYGRRETTVSAGGAVERREARNQARAAFEEYGEPEETYEVGTTSLKGPQPFYDYDVADIVLAPTKDGRGRARVLSISWTETESGDVEWTHQLYPV